jgi:hypothetical protein
MCCVWEYVLVRCNLHKFTLGEEPDTILIILERRVSCKWHDNERQNFNFSA